MDMPREHTLYLCYFGLREPLVQTQVLPYLRELAAGGLRVSLLTFEPRLRRNWDAAQIVAQRAQLLSEGISWHLLAYHKRPSLPVTLYDIALGALYAANLARREDVTIFHGRVHLGAAMGALAKWLAGGRVKLIFDIRGFMPEEYTDGGMWPPNGVLYRGLKAVERRLLASSDAFVVLTERAREILFPGRTDTDEKGRPVEVIPCCVDENRFQRATAQDREALRRELGLVGRRVFVYLGSLGGWYLTDELMAFLAHARRNDPQAFALILTQRNVDQARQRLLAEGVGAEDMFVTQVTPAEVPRYLAAADVAVSFIKRCYSKQSSSPTKIAEYLAAGLPVVSNDGIGDLDELLEGERVGVLVREFTPMAYDQALMELAKLDEADELRLRCRAVAREQFDLHTVGGPRYRRLYQRLLVGQVAVPVTHAALIPEK